jgi:hypothetical protein
VSVAAITDRPIPMQLSTSVGAAAKRYAVPPKDERACVDVNSVGTLNQLIPPIVGQCMIVEGMIAGKPATILLDSGAQSSHISTSFVERHQLPTDETSMYTSLVMADGHRQPVTSMVSNVEVQMNDCKEGIDMLVMPMTHYDAILGMSWHYAHYPVTYDMNSVRYMHDGVEQTLYRNDIAYRDIKLKTLISAVEIKRMLHKDRLRVDRDGGVDASQPHDEIYIMYMSSANAKQAGVRDDTVNDMVPSSSIINDDANREARISSIMNGDASAEGDDISDMKYREYFMKNYPSVCGDPPLELPPKREFDHHIELIPGAEPAARPAYRESALHNDELKRQLDELLKAGYIRPSNSSFASPVLFVKKADGSLRMCIDYRGLNKITQKSKYPLPHTEDLIERLHNANYLTKLDLRSGYHQLRMADDSIDKTAFITRYGLYEFLVMPFGLCNAPSTFMRMMNDILRPLMDTCVIVFLDDILIYSSTIEQHYKDVSSVFDLWQENKLYVKMSKCEFFRHEVQFLGHIVGKGYVKMCPDKLDAIHTWPAPKNVHELKSFLGMCGYYRKFVKGFSEIAAPLFDLTKADQREYAWREIHQQSFEQLRNALLNGPVLKLPDHNKDWIMYCDASGQCVGGVLAQHDDNGDLRPVLFMSHKLSGAELNWPVHDKEMYAIIYMLKQCRMYVQGKHVTIYTDHRSLEHFMTQPSLSPRQTRWMEYLASYDWNIVYKQGKYNVVADALSRRPTNNDEENKCNVLQVFAVSAPIVVDNFMDEVKDGYDNDEACEQVLKNGGTPLLSVRDGYIYKGSRLYIPCIDSIKKRLLVEYHDAVGSGGHRGAAATHHKLIQHYYWPHMYEEVVTYVRECHECQASKSVNQLPSGLLQPLPIPQYPLEDISMDFITHLPRTISGNVGILVVVDRLIKYVKLIATSTQDDSGIPAAERTAQLFLTNWVRTFGIPKTIVSDRDVQFTSMFWTELFKTYGTQLMFSSAYHPQTDGQTERTNRTLQEILRAYVHDEQDAWDEHLWHAEVAINTSPHTSTGESPHNLLFGRAMSVPATILHQQTTHVPIVDEVIKSQEERLMLVRNYLMKAQEKQKKYADSNRRDISFNVGDYVWVSTSNLHKPNDDSTKLKHKYAGPYKILEKIGNVTYKLQLPEVQLARKVHPVYHVSKLRKYYPRLTSFADDDGNDVPTPPSLVDEADDVEEWEVEAIKGKRKVRNQVQYLVKWKGFSHWHNSWEPAHMLTNAKEVIQEYNIDKAIKSIEETRLDVEKVAKNTSHRGARGVHRRRRGEVNTASAYIHPLNVLFNQLTI